MAYNMPTININFNEPAWPELAKIAGTDQLIEVTTPISITGLKGGMQSGRTSVTLRCDLPDGKVVLIQTSLRVLLATARAFQARFGNDE